jgi:putative glutathione S-transferase
VTRVNDFLRLLREPVTHRFRSAGFQCRNRAPYAAQKESDDMGMLEHGRWKENWYDTKSTGGHFVRTESQFRNWITPDGAVGPTGEGGFSAEKGRYRLYVSYACPWASRTLIFRKLKHLEDLIPVTVVHWFMGKGGWEFREEDDANRDEEFGATHLHQIYTAARPDYSGRVTVPVLWDRKRKTIVNNESAEIIRMFNSAFAKLARPAPDFAPPELLARIDEINARVYETVNNGVYRCGFATKQEAYDEAFKALFDSLDWLDKLLSANRYLCGSRLTEADWRLFTTLVRFDPVYVGHFKCNLRRIEDYPNLSNYLRELFQMPGVADTVNFHHIRNHYYRSHTSINPHGIVPGGQEIDLRRPHDRGRLVAKAA